jgi:hypothetical protein
MLAVPGVTEIEPKVGDEAQLAKNIATTIRVEIATDR